MAYATIKGRRQAVRVTKDLTDNYSIEVYPEPAKGAEKKSEPFKTWPVPAILKLHADSRAHALVAGLEHMKKLGKIDDYHVDESEKPPAPPPAEAKPAPAAAAAKPAPAAAKPAETKPAEAKKAE